MASITSYDTRDTTRRRKHRKHRHRSPSPEVGYRETVEVQRDPNGGALVRRERQDSEFAVQEVARYPPVRSQSMDRVYYEDRGYGYPDERDRFDPYYGSERGSSGRGRHGDQDRRKSKARSKSRGQEVLGAAVGAGLGLVGKRYYDQQQQGQSARRRSASRKRMESVAAGVAGAAAGYGASKVYERSQSQKRGEGRYEDEYGYDRGSSRPSRSKSFSEQASKVIGSLGLADALGGGGGGSRRGRDDYDRRGSRRSRHGSYSSDDDYYDSRSRHRSGGGGLGELAQGPMGQAGLAALMAGATEAMRVRKEPGGWGGDKAKRVFTAAATAGGSGAFLDRNGDDRNSTRNVLLSTATGLLSNRMVNGSREEEFGGRRGRRRSEGGGILSSLATAGLVGAAGKALTNRSRSRGPRGRDEYSDDSYSPSPPPHGRRRSKSVTEFVSGGLSRLGLDDGRSSHGGDRDRRRSHHKNRSRTYDDYDDRDSRVGYDEYDRHRSTGGYNDGGYPQSRSVIPAAAASGYSENDREGRLEKRESRRSGNRASSSDSSSMWSMSSAEEDKERKKMKGKEMVTAGLATIATIHAAHGLYQNMEAHEKRKKEVMEGKMSRIEAKKKQNKARLQDVAAFGIAGLGVKGAYSEWKDMEEQRKKFREFEKKRGKMREKRQQQRARSLNGANRYRNSAPNFTAPTYEDGNPYQPPPPPPPPPGNYPPAGNYPPPPPGHFDDRPY